MSELFERKRFSDEAREIGGLNALQILGCDAVRKSMSGGPLRATRTDDLQCSSRVMQEYAASVTTQRTYIPVPETDSQTERWTDFLGCNDLMWHEEDLIKGTDAYRLAWLSLTQGMPFRRKTRRTEDPEDFFPLVGAVRDCICEVETLAINQWIHDIRSPLTALINYPSYLESTPDISVEEVGTFLDEYAEKLNTLSIKNVFAFFEFFNQNLPLLLQFGAADLKCQKESGDKIIADFKDGLTVIINYMQHFQSRMEGEAEKAGLLNLEDLGGPLASFSRMLNPCVDFRYDTFDDCTVLASLSGMNRILFNLVRNAHEAIDMNITESPAAIKIQVQPVCEQIAEALGLSKGEHSESDHLCIPPKTDQPLIRIGVQDTGYGIYPGVLPHIFRLKFSTKKKKEDKTRGLGLSSVLEQVKRYNGGIVVISKLGKGTSFNILLPAASIDEGEGSSGHA